MKRTCFFALFLFVVLTGLSACAGSEPSYTQLPAAMKEESSAVASPTSEISEEEKTESEHTETSAKAPEPSAAPESSGPEELLTEERSSSDTVVSGSVEEASAAEVRPSAAPQSFVADWSTADWVTQIVAVLADGTAAEVSLHQKNADGLWTQVLSTSGYVGYSGVGQASEGSMITPAGVYTLTQAFGVSPDPGSGLPYVQVDTAHYWVDDPDSAYYNQFVSTDTVSADWDSAEHLIDSPTAYAYAVAIDYNLSCTPGAGSAFFLHCETGEPTYGCVAVPRQDMVSILQQLTGGAVIAIGEKGDCF